MSRVCIRFFTRNGYNTVGPSTPFYTQPRCFCRSTLGPFLARLKKNNIYKGLSGALVTVGIFDGPRLDADNQALSPPDRWGRRFR